MTTNTITNMIAALEDFEKVFEEPMNDNNGTNHVISLHIRRNEAENIIRRVKWAKEALKKEIKQ